MHLPWRDVMLGDGPAISTSVTAAEAAVLAGLARDAGVLEIGSAFGYSACLMALAGARHVTAVDPHDQLASHEVMTANLAARGLAGAVTVVRGASPDALGGLGPFGLAFIDGDHRAAAVTADVTAALKLLAPGGVLAVHDYGEDCCCPGVRLALDALYPAGPSEQEGTLFVVRT